MEKPGKRDRLGGRALRYSSTGLKTRVREHALRPGGRDLSRLPEESRLLAAMDHGLPPCSGCALGFDRLVMAATGAKTIQEVMAFPMERA